MSAWPLAIILCSGAYPADIDTLSVPSDMSTPLPDVSPGGDVPGPGVEPSAPPSSPSEPPTSPSEPPTSPSEPPQAPPQGDPPPGDSVAPEPEQPREDGVAEDPPPSDGAGEEQQDEAAGAGAAPGGVGAAGAGAGASTSNPGGPGSGSTVGGGSGSGGGGTGGTGPRGAGSGGAGAGGGSVPPSAGPGGGSGSGGGSTAGPGKPPIQRPASSAPQVSRPQPTQPSQPRAAESGQPTQPVQPSQPEGPQPPPEDSPDLPDTRDEEEEQPSPWKLGGFRLFRFGFAAKVGYTHGTSQKNGIFDRDKSLQDSIDNMDVTTSGAGDLGGAQFGGPMYGGILDLEVFGVNAWLDFHKFFKPGGMVSALIGYDHEFGLGRRLRLDIGAAFGMQHVFLGDQLMSFYDEITIDPDNPLATDVATTGIEARLMADLHIHLAGPLYTGPGAMLGYHYLFSANTAEVTEEKGLHYSFGWSIRVDFALPSNRRAGRKEQ